jgi:hypothetical protein
MYRSLLESLIYHSIGTRAALVWKEVGYFQEDTVDQTSLEEVQYLAGDDLTVDPSQEHQGSLKFRNLGGGDRLGVRLKRFTQFDSQ